MKIHDWWSVLPLPLIAPPEAVRFFIGNEKPLKFWHDVEGKKHVDQPASPLRRPRCKDFVMVCAYVTRGYVVPAEWTMSYKHNQIHELAQTLSLLGTFTLRWDSLREALALAMMVSLKSRQRGPKVTVGSQGMGHNSQSACSSRQG